MTIFFEIKPVLLDDSQYFQMIELLLEPKTSGQFDLRCRVTLTGLFDGLNFAVNKTKYSKF